MRAELAGERPHRLVLRAGGDPQAAVTLRSRFRDQLSKQDAADALASHAVLDAESDFGLRIRGLIGRMQLRRAAYHAVLDIGDDDSTVVSAFRGIAFDEVVIHEAMKAIMSALRIEPQQVVAQLRQFLLLTQRPNVAPGTRRTGNVFVSHGNTPLGWPSRRRRIPRPPILCIATWNPRLLSASNKGNISRILAPQGFRYR